MAEKTNMMEAWESEFEEGTSISKCRHCGCMKGALEEMRSSLAAAHDAQLVEALKKVDRWVDRMEATLYT